MIPSAAAGACRVDVSRLGSSEVGISWPASESRLAVPMPATPGVSHRSLAGEGSVTAAVSPRRFQTAGQYRGGARGARVVAHKSWFHTHRARRHAYETTFDAPDRPQSTQARLQPSAARTWSGTGVGVLVPGTTLMYTIVAVKTRRSPTLPSTTMS